MNEVTYLIVGGGVAGTTAAETLRASDKEGSIAIVSDEPHRFYSRILLSKPNFFLEKIPFDQIWLKEESWYAQNRVALLLGRQAAKLDPSGKIVTLDDGSQWRYRKLLLAVGTRARKWGVPGADKKGVLSLRTLDDAKEIISRVKTAKQAILIGSGFISFEMAEMLRLAGVDVTLVILESYYWEPLLDEISGRMIEKALLANGVKIRHKSEVAQIEGGESVEGIILKDGTKLPCQLIIAGIGVDCSLDWVKASGVETNRGILADEYLQTTAPDIWTAGDVAEFNDAILGERVQLGNWVNAQMQGRAAGANMLGQKQPFRLVSFYTTQGFGITIGFVGNVRVTPDREVVPRGSAEEGKYGRLILHQDKLVGATLVNLAGELGSVSKLIEKGTDLSAKKSEISRLGTNLQVLL
uniref:NAD(P)/FAD-dependent oxidoreductase n=1 Tax=candidate division WWE3 bacterium TaxID=2053526 RepID=A0A831YYH3_UNCKA